MDWSQEVRDTFAGLTSATYAADVRAEVERASVAERSFRPAPGEWSIVEILRHLGDTEVVRQMRFDRMLAEDNPYIERPDPTPGERDTEDALVLQARWERLRALALSRLEAMTEAEWRRGAIQGPDPQVNRTAPEPTTVLREARKMNLHAGRHLEQIRNNLAACRG